MEERLNNHFALLNVSKTGPEKWQILNTICKNMNEQEGPEKCQNRNQSLEK